MNTNIIERLFTSFADLEKAILSAKTSLAKKANMPTGLSDRIKSYDSILAKQRHLAVQLSEYMTQGNWDEVGRHVSLINGLSAMIRDDARCILSALSGEDEKAPTDTLMC
jgi:hypothetical protein